MKTISNKSIPITLFVLLVLFVNLFFYCHGNISTDTGREAMIPYAVLKGEILYRDILNIYAPLAYYINAIFYKIFGTRLESLYFAGAISSVVFLFTIFEITKKFLSKNISLLITLFVALSCVYNSRLFNFIFPYSYSMTYGITFFALSLLFILKVLESKNEKYLTIAALFAGLSFACKIEFFPLVFLTLFVAFYTFKESAKKIIKTIIFFITPPLVVYSIPFIQGLKIQEAIYALKIFLLSAQVPSVIDFAKQTGTAFRIEDIIVWLSGTLLLAVFLACSYFLFKKAKNKTLIVLFGIITAIIHFVSRPETHFSFLCITILLFVLTQYKKLRKEPSVLILAAGAVIASLRSVFIVNTNEYGAFSCPLLLIALLALINLDNDKISEKLKINTEHFIIFVLSAAILSNFIYSTMQIKMYSCPIKTERGRIDTTEEWQKGAQKAIDFIKKQTDEKEKVLFLPEGSMFNFLSERDTDMRMYALNAPYIETYGESNIVKMTEEANIKYIAIIDGFGLYNFNKARFYFTENEITKYIQQNYKVIYEDKSPTYQIIILEK